MVVADFRRDVKIGTEESGSQFGHQFLAGVAFVAPSLAPKVAVRRLRVLGPVGQLVRERGVIALGSREASKGGIWI